MKRILLPVLLAASCATAGAQTAFINEYDYDQPGTDNAEFVEVAVDLASCPGGCAPADFQVVLYNGSNGTSYDTDALPATAVGMDGPLSLFLINYPSNGIQNGSPDGIALVYQGAVLQFLSYEGSFTAVGGPADGLTSTDVGVAEDNNAPNVSTARDAAGAYTTGTPTPGAPNSAPLPVALAAFDARATGMTAELSWAVASQQDNAYFAVEVSRDGRAFAEVARVDGDGTRGGLVEYAYAYAAELAGQHYFRLRQVDFDGAFEFSDVVSVDLRGTRFGVRYDASLQVAELDAEDGGDFGVYDLSGALLTRLTVRTGGIATIDLSGLPAGLYVVSDGLQSVRLVKP